MLNLMDEGYKKASDFEDHIEPKVSFLYINGEAFRVKYNGS